MFLTNRNCVITVIKEFSSTKKKIGFFLRCKCRLLLSSCTIVELVLFDTAYVRLIKAFLSVFSGIRILGIIDRYIAMVVAVRLYHEILLL